VKKQNDFVQRAGIDIMVLRGWKLVHRVRWHLRRQEVPLGAILVMLLAVTTGTVIYLYY